MDLSKTTIGAIGLGQMGGGIAANLVKAGFAVLGYDPAADAQHRLQAAGGELADSVEAVLDACDVVLLCVHGSVAVPLTEQVLIERCREGQILIDHSTIPAPRARAFGEAFAARGVRYMDVPVSGGHVGAARGELRMFAGGDREVSDACRPLFEAAGNPMARLEVMALGLRSGLDKTQLMQALDVEADSDDPYAHFYRMVEQDDKEQLGLLASEWPYYLEQAAAVGMRMPMLEGLWDLVKGAPRTTADNLNRPMPCLWDELMR